MYHEFDKQIPADMVVNAILVAMVAHANQPSDILYHVGSSVLNPIRYLNLQEYGFRYFKAKPWINKDGSIVKVGSVTMLPDMASFKRYMFIRYLLPLQVLIYIFFKVLIIQISRLGNNTNTTTNYYLQNFFFLNLICFLTFTFDRD